MRTSLPIRIRVNLVNGESVHLASPILEAGTALVGRVRTQNSSVFHRVPLQEVESLEWPEVSAGRTVLLGVVITAALVGAAALAIANSDFCMFCGWGEGFGGWVSPAGSRP
jgi:hypothetical protein